MRPDSVLSLTRRSRMKMLLHSWGFLSPYPLPRCGKGEQFVGE